MTHDTTALNRARHRFDGAPAVWLFGYGSLIWKADFDYLDRRHAHLHGWSRRFWQGSHDHRGTPEAPGRVLTLARDPGASCAGVAYLVTPAVFDALDHREKNGYLRHVEPLVFDDGSRVDGLVYIADGHNAAWLGPASDTAIARQIAAAHGPSGANRDYVLHLADALRAQHAEDAHVFAIERELHRLAGLTAR
ncbi:MAG: gamma-glutamylcyclotransferase [Dokdonella sp.]|uniref:gamma-glutamylcyclotransferase n=1 Tax=Dokdonella sp. TaxID=2291710 RepID=UPI003F822917